jgi:hypothetical protein
LSLWFVQVPAAVAHVYHGACRLAASLHWPIARLHGPGVASDAFKLLGSGPLALASDECMIYTKADLAAEQLALFIRAYLGSESSSSHPRHLPWKIGSESVYVNGLPSESLAAVRSTRSSVNETEQ